MVFILAMQSVSASGSDLDAIYSNDLDLGDSSGSGWFVGEDSSGSGWFVGEDSSGSGWFVGEDSSGSDLSIAEDSEATSDSSIENSKELSSSLESDSLSDGDDNRNSTKISANPISVNYGSDANLKINLTDDKGNGLSNKVIFVQINGNKSNLTTDASGLANFKYSNAAGVYNLILSFNGDELYAPSNASTKITIEKAATNLKVPSVRSYLTSSTYVAATLTDSKGIALANKRVYLVISGKTYDAITDSKGVAKIKIPTKISYLAVSVKFDGDENYSVCSISSKVVITKMKTSLIVPIVKSHITKKTYLKITLKNVYGKALANKSIKVIVGKKTYNLKTNANGVAKLKFAKKISRFKCTVKFKATKTYYGASKVSKVIITKTPVVIKAPKVSFNSTRYGRLKINLTDIDGKALKKKVLTVSIPSSKKIFKVKTNSKGIATLKFNGPKSYNVIIKFAGDKNYSKKSVKSKFVVKKVKVKFNDVLGAAKVLKEYISENKSLPSEVKYKNYTFTTAQLSYLMAVAIRHVKSKNKNDIVLIAVSAPSKSSGEIYDTVYKKDYFKIVDKAVGSSINHKTHKYIRHSFYKIPYKIYTAEFSRILNYYKENKRLPNYSLFTSSEFVKVSNSSKYTFYLTTDNIAGKKSDLKMLKRLAKTLKSKGYNAVIVGIGPDIHNIAYRYGCTGKNSVLLCCFGGVDIGCIEEWTGEIGSLNGHSFVENYNGAHVLGLWYSKPYGASVSLHKKVGIAWDANYGRPLANPAKYMSKHNISYIETGTVTSACNRLKAGKMGGPKLIK